MTHRWILSLLFASQTSWLFSTYSSIDIDSFCTIHPQHLVLSNIIFNHATSYSISTHRRGTDIDKKISEIKTKGNI